MFSLRNIGRRLYKRLTRSRPVDSEKSPQPPKTIKELFGEHVLYRDIESKIKSAIKLLKEGYTPSLYEIKFLGWVYDKVDKRTLSMLGEDRNDKGRIREVRQKMLEDICTTKCLAEKAINAPVTEYFSPERRFVEVVGDLNECKYRWPVKRTIDEAGILYNNTGARYIIFEGRLKKIQEEPKPTEQKLVRKRVITIEETIEEYVPANA